VVRRAGFNEAVAGTGVTGICGSGIIEVIAEMYLAGIISQDGVVDGELAARSDRIVQTGRTFAYTMYRGAVSLAVTQNDVRAIQLAKAALHAGVRLLMDHMGVDHVDRIRLAGAFGNHIDVKYATILGMIPDCELSQVSSAGNAAGTGARIALLDKASRKTVEELVQRVEKIETAIEPKFQAHFVARWAFRTRASRICICGGWCSCRPRRSPRHVSARAGRARAREPGLSLSGQTVRYSVGGTGPALVFVHGTPFSSHVWHRVAPHFVDTHTVYSFDCWATGNLRSPKTRTFRSGYRTWYSASCSNTGASRSPTSSHTTLAAPRRCVRIC